MKYETVWCEGYWSGEPEHIYEVKIALGGWDGVEDYEDEGIFFYMDGEPLEVGTVLDDGFVITQVNREDE